MICHSYYEDDARIRREAAALRADGREVDIVSLRMPDSPAEALVDDVRVHRISVQHIQGRSVTGYMGEYLSFLTQAAFTATRLHRRRRYGLVQVHTLPDFLVFAALPIRLTGVPVVLDLHEAMPPFFRTRFKKLDRPLLVRCLELVERASIGAADAVITVNDALRDRLIDKGVDARKISVLLNSPDPALFDASAHPRRLFAEDGVLRLVYAGSLTPLYDVELVIEAVALLATGGDGREPLGACVSLDVYGRGDCESRLREVTAQYGLEGQVRFHGRVPVETIAGRIAAADVGVAPTRPDGYTHLSMSTKLFEYGAMGKPVLASRLATVERYFGPDTLAYFDPGDPASASAALRRLMNDPGWREQIVARTSDRIAKFSWGGEADRYRILVRRLAKKR
jgi:glycosyltransferase involved in cell wall biosynthesis